MQYINNTLLKDERVLKIVRPHWIVFALPIFVFILAILLFLGLFGNVRSQVVIYGLTVVDWAVVCAFLFGVYATICSCITFYFSEYGITTKRVLMKEGMIQRTSFELFLNKVEAIHVDQSILGRMMDYGTLTVIGTGGSRDPFRYVPFPLQFRKVIQQQIDKYDGRR